MSAPAARLLREHFDEIVDLGAQRTRSEIAQYRTVSFEQLRPNVAAGFGSVLTDLENPPYRQYRKVFSEISYRRARQGFEILNLNAVVDLTEEILYQFIGLHIADSVEQIPAIMACHGVCGSARLGIMESFGRSNHEHLSEANKLIEQLSSPLLPLYPGVIVLPLIGAIDAQRSQRILEALLTGVTTYRAKVAVIDITGAAEMTTDTAGYLIRAARATELLGARVILAGVSPLVAKVLSKSGSELARITSTMNLQLALEYAFRERGLVIRAIEKP